MCVCVCVCVCHNSVDCHFWGLCRTKCNIIWRMVNI